VRKLNPKMISFLFVYRILGLLDFVLNFQTSNFTLQTSNKLSPEDNKLLKEYDDIWFSQICRRDELIYSAALMDNVIKLSIHKKGNVSETLCPQSTG
jgi:hypothetical protein